MPRNALLIASAAVFCVGCPEATPYPFPEVEPPGDASTEEEVPTPIEPETELDIELCELEGTEELGEREFMIQIRNRECSTSICLHYNLLTFCTWRCEEDDDCRELARGSCELEIFAGDPEMFGWYCVPAFASRDDDEA